MAASPFQLNIFAAKMDFWPPDLWVSKSSLLCRCKRLQVKWLQKYFYLLQGCKSKWKLVRWPQVKWLQKSFCLLYGRKSGGCKSSGRKNIFLYVWPQVRWPQVKWPKKKIIYYMAASQVAVSQVAAKIFLFIV